MSKKPKTGKTINCQTCGKEFYIPINRFNTAKFCSPKCRGMSAFKSFNRKCIICGNDFEYKACREGKVKYCSRKCYYKGQHLKGKTVVRCLFCKKEFRTAFLSTEYIVLKNVYGKQRKRIYDTPR